MVMKQLIPEVFIDYDPYGGGFYTLPGTPSYTPPPVDSIYKGQQIPETITRAQPLIEPKVEPKPTLQPLIEPKVAPKPTLQPGILDFKNYDLDRPGGLINQKNIPMPKMGPFTPATTPSKSKNQQLGFMLYALGGALRGDKNFVEKTIQLKDIQDSKKREKEMKDNWNKALGNLEGSINPTLIELARVLGPEKGAQLVVSGINKKGQTYKPELVEFENTSNKDIQVGNFVIKPGQRMPFNVAIPEIANAISGVSGLKEIKDTTVYTRQGNTYLTDEGNYKEIIVGDRRVFDGPSGQLNAEQFFAKYPKARMTTSGEEQRYIPDFKTFTGLNKELVTEEKSLKQILSYWKNITDSNVGIKRLGDQMATWFETLAGGQNLTTEQLARAIAEGKLQGLIGANRIDTVGGGVMTEKDAWRVIARLGGDVNALQNPAVVGPLLEEMFRLKVESYNEDIKGYNLGVESGRFKGYEKRTPITQEEITSKFTLLPQGIPAGSKKVVVQGMTLYQLGDKYYAVLPSGIVEEVEID